MSTTKTVFRYSFPDVRPLEGQEIKTVAGAKLVSAHAVRGAPTVYAEVPVPANPKSAQIPCTLRVVFVMTGQAFVRPPGARFLGTIVLGDDPADPFVLHAYDVTD